MALLSLSDELMLQVVESLNVPSDLNCLARICKHLYYKVNPILYHIDRVLNNNAALIWAATKNVPGTLRYAVSAGTIVADQHLPLLHLAASRGHVEMIASLMQEYNVDASKYNQGGETALIAAVQYPDAVKELLANGADLSQTTVEGESPVFAAIRRGHADTVALLLKNRLEELSQMTSKWGHRSISPLHEAARMGRTDVVLMLLDHGMDPTMADSFDETGGSPLAYALCESKFDTAKVLLEAGTDPNAVTLGPRSLHSPLYFASIGGDVEFVKLLLQHGAVPTVDVSSGMPLNAAAYAPRAVQVEITSLLLEKGADINHQCEYGKTALHDAIMMTRPHLALFLIQAGADTSLADCEGEVPLHAATIRAMPKVVKALIKRGANVNYSDKKGRTPLDIAVKNSCFAVAKLLLKNSADARDICSDFNVLCGVCTGSRASKMLRLLFDHGADIFMTGPCRITLLHEAAHWGPLDAVEFLLQHGVDPSARECEGYTPLHFAARSGQTDIVKCLAEYGIDLCPVSNDNLTPLTEAVVENHLDTVRYLLGSLPRTELGRSVQCGYTPLLVAMQFSKPDTIRLLLDLGADINDTTSIGAGPLIVAMANKNVDVVKLILSLGTVDINQQDIDSRTALYMASLRGSVAAVELLVLQHPPPISNTRDRYGGTPLIVAARNGHAEVLSLLLKLDDAPLLNVDMFGHDVFYWASECGHPAVRELLEPYAQAVGVDIQDHGRHPVAFLDVVCHCDVCGRCVSNITGPLQVCRLCTAGYCGKFIVCTQCRDNGAMCRDQSHTLEAKKSDYCYM